MAGGGGSVKITERLTPETADSTLTLTTISALPTAVSADLDSLLSSLSPQSQFATPEYVKIAMRLSLFCPNHTHSIPSLTQIFGLSLSILFYHVRLYATPFCLRFT
jgi:hypothetical protein